MYLLAISLEYCKYHLHEFAHSIYLNCFGKNKKLIFIEITKENWVGYNQQQVALSNSRVEYVEVSNRHEGQHQPVF